MPAWQEPLAPATLCRRSASCAGIVASGYRTEQPLQPRCHSAAAFGTQQVRTSLGRPTANLIRAALCRALPNLAAGAARGCQRPPQPNAPPPLAVWCSGTCGRQPNLWTGRNGQARPRGCAGPSCRGRAGGSAVHSRARRQRAEAAGEGTRLQVQTHSCIVLLHSGPGAQHGCALLPQAATWA